MKCDREKRGEKPLSWIHWDQVPSPQFPQFPRSLVGEDVRKKGNRKGVAVSLWFFLSSLSYFWPFHVVVYLVLFSMSGSRGDHGEKLVTEEEEGTRDGDLENAHGAMQAAESFHGQRMIAGALSTIIEGSNSSRDLMTDESQMIK